MSEENSKFDCRYGRFVTFGEGDLISRSLATYGEWAQGEIDMLAKFISEGDVVIDAGAFIGTHARAFSSLVGPFGKVYAFEPNRDSFNLLKENLRLADLPNIEAFPSALAAKRELRIFNVTPTNGNRGAFQLVDANSEEARCQVEMTTLDSYGFDQVDLLKADVEGMELDVLNGAADTIERCKPVVFLEMNTLASAVRILDWAIARNYKMFGIILSAFNAQNFKYESENIFGDARECGVVLIDRDKSSSWMEDELPISLTELTTPDDLAALLFQKPQYITEVVSRTPVRKRAEGYGCFRSDHADLQQELRLFRAAKESAEKLAVDREREITYINERLAATESAKAEAERLAFARLDELNKLDEQLKLTEKAKSYAERLAIDRLEENQALLRKIDELVAVAGNEEGSQHEGAGSD